ncbi:DUF1552 domain-containing protein [Marinicellulosiphila megalodicopiae]|uniref:DUF1552 domain-containing protein n=1 Tax=Marinicellulosiphila megalodicopiae TaxID=2724896 RepID=UPI003BAEC4EF
MKNFNLNRRSLLKSTAAFAGASSLSMAMVERALAATSHKRVIFWYVPEGCAQQGFWPANTGALDINMNASINGKNVQSKGNSIRSYVDSSQAGYVIQPLKEFESEISMYSGFKNNGSDADDPHKQVVENALTGGKKVEGSIDQILGDKFKASTPISSIYTGMWGHHVHTKGTNEDYLNPLRTIGGNTKGNANWNPMETYKTVFGNDGIPAPTGGGGGDIGFTSRHSQLEVLKQMESRLAAVKCVGGEQARLKYEALLNSFTNLEQQTQALIKADEEMAMENGPDMRFDIPNGWLNTNGNVTDRKYYWNDSVNYEKLMDISIDTTVAALALNRTRVSLLQFSGSGTDKGAIDKNHYRNFARVDGTGNGVPGLEGNGDVNDHNLGHDPAQDRRRNQARIHRWYYSKLAQLITKLKAIPDGDGNMFDSTLIVTCSEFSMYNHRSNDMPYMVCGNGGGAFKTGQYLDARQGNNFRSHADFFLSVAQGLDSGLTRFGTSTNPYTDMLT